VGIETNVGIGVPADPFREQPEVVLYIERTRNGIEPVPYKIMTLEKRD